MLTHLAILHQGFFSRLFIIIFGFASESDQMGYDL